MGQTNRRPEQRKEMKQTKMEFQNQEKRKDGIVADKLTGKRMKFQNQEKIWSKQRKGIIIPKLTKGEKVKGNSRTNK